MASRIFPALLLGLALAASAKATASSSPTEDQDELCVEAIRGNDMGKIVKHCPITSGGAWGGPGPKWYYHGPFTSPRDDSKYAYASLSSLEGEARLEAFCWAPKSFSVRLHVGEEQGIVDLDVSCGSYDCYRRTYVTWRFDEAKKKSANWDRSEKENMVYDSSPKAFLRDVWRSSTLRVFVPMAYRPDTFATFDLTKGKAALQQMAKLCGRQFNAKGKLKRSK